MTPSRQPMPSDTRADTRQPRPVATYIPPRNTVLDVLYNGQQFNETPIGMFEAKRVKSAVVPKQVANPTGLHRFTDSKGRPNNWSKKRTGKNERGPIYATIFATLRQHPEGLTLDQLFDETGGGDALRRRRMGHALTSMKKAGEVTQAKRLAPWVLVSE